MKGSRTAAASAYVDIRSSRDQRVNRLGVGGFRRVVQGSFSIVVAGLDIRSRLDQGIYLYRVAGLRPHRGGESLLSSRGRKCLLPP